MKESREGRIIGGAERGGVVGSDGGGGRRRVGRGVHVVGPKWV
jgi:hypothetical protein